MKFCGKCGAQLDDNATFCGSCGAAQEVQVQPAAAQTNNDPIMDKVNSITKGNPVKIIIAAVAAVVAIFAIIFITRSVIGSGALTAKGAVKKYVKAVAAQDFKKILNYAMTKPMYKASEMNKKEFIEEDGDFYDKDDAYKIKDFKVKKVKTYSGKKVKDYNEDFYDEYDVKPHIKKLAVVTVTYKVYDEDSEDWEKVEKQYTTYKYHGNWYVLRSLP